MPSMVASGLPCSVAWSVRQRCRRTSGLTVIAPGAIRGVALRSCCEGTGRCGGGTAGADPDRLGRATTGPGGRGWAPGAPRSDGISAAVVGAGRRGMAGVGVDQADGSHGRDNPAANRSNAATERTAGSGHPAPASTAAAHPKHGSHGPAGVAAPNRGWELLAVHGDTLNRWRRTGLLPRTIKRPQNKSHLFYAAI
jgi:hypothetical protein